MHSQGAERGSVGFEIISHFDQAVWQSRSQNWTTYILFSSYMLFQFSLEIRGAFGLTCSAAAAAAAAKSLQSCLTLCDPIDGSPPGSPVPGILRQEYCSGLPFPSPMDESEKWKWSRSVVSDSSRPHGLQPTRLLCPWDFLGKSTGVGCHCLLRNWLYPDTK